MHRHIQAGSLEMGFGKGKAEYYFEVDGQTKDIIVLVEMSKEANQDWKVVEIEEIK